MLKLPLSVTLAVQVRMKGWPAVKGPFSGVMEASTDNEGTAKRFSVEKQIINIRKLRCLMLSHPSLLLHPGTLIASKYEKHQSTNLAHACITYPIASCLVYTHVSGAKPLNTTKNVLMTDVTARLNLGVLPAVAWKHFCKRQIYHQLLL